MHDGSGDGNDGDDDDPAPTMRTVKRTSQQANLPFWPGQYKWKAISEHGTKVIVSNDIKFTVLIISLYKIL